MAIFLDLDNKIRYWKLELCLFDKRESFPLSIAKMLDKPSNIPSNVLSHGTSTEL